MSGSCRADNHDLTAPMIIAMAVNVSIPAAGDGLLPLHSRPCYQEVGSG